MMVGTSASAALLRHGFRDALVLELKDWPDRNSVSTLSNICRRGLADRVGYRKQIIKKVLADGHAAAYLPKAFQAMVLSSYIHGFLFVSGTKTRFAGNKYV